MRTGDNRRSIHGSLNEVYCFHSDSLDPVNFDAAPLASDNHTMTCDANGSNTNVLTVSATNSVNNDENCGDDDADGASYCYDFASHFVLVAVAAAANMNRYWLAHEPVLHMEFQIEFSTEPYNNDKAMNSHTSPTPRDHCSRRNYVKKKKKKKKNKKEIDLEITCIA